MKCENRKYVHILSMFVDSLLLITITKWILLCFICIYILYEYSYTAKKSERVDWWSFGILLYEMMTGFHCFIIKMKI